MSQSSEPDTPTAAGIISELGQPPQSLFHAVQGFVEFNAALHDLDVEIADAEADADANNEQEAFLALPPSNDTFDNDNVFSVGAESQFSDSTPPTPSKNLRTQLEELRILMGILKSSIPVNGQSFFDYLNHKFTSYPQIQIYGNHPIVADFGQNMLVPMLSFYGITTKDGVASIKPNIGEITTDIKSMVARIFIPPKVGLGSSTAQQAVVFEELSVDCPMPTATNLCWNVRLTLNGNIFTLLTFRIVAMKSLDDFEPQQYPLSPQNQYIHLCFALLSKACAKDFNCLCSMPDIDVQLFNLILSQVRSLDELISLVKRFLTELAEPQLDSKRSYMVTALHNLVSSVNVVDTTITGETLAYKMLFDGDVSGSGANTFNPIMRQITELIQILRSLDMELQVSLCGGRMIYKLGDVLRKYDFTSAVASNPATIGYLSSNGNAQYLVEEMKKQLNAPSDSDYTLTFAGFSALEPGFVQTLLMFFTLCSQLGIKKTIDEFCTSNPQYAALFLRERAVIGMSLVGGDFQLSSARNSCDALAFLDEINIRGGVNPALNTFLAQFPRDLNRVPKSSLAPCDLVPKMPSGNYIVKISHYIFDSGYTTIAIPANIDEIADRISRYSMSTDEGFSSPVKVLFDILFTLFSIENFTNRAFVTQKINKELKRIAICASILFFHFNELLQMPYLEGSPERQRINELLQAQQSDLVGSPQRQQIDTELLQFQQRLLYPEGSPQRREITTMLQILGNVINYGYTPAYKLLSDEIHTIMTAYASCFVQLLHLYHLGVVFYSRVPDATLLAIGPRNTLTRLETDCMQMIDPAHVPAQAEGLLHGKLPHVITAGVRFLDAIRKDGNLTGLLQIKDRVKAADLRYKAEGKFLTSVEAFDLFLRDFVPMLVPPSPLVASLDQLLAVFRSPELELAELMHFQPIVVIKSENLRIPKNDPHGLIVTGEYQFGIYVILSIFGVKFKSEWSKISLFTRMLFYQLLSRADAMHGVCSILLGVDLNKVDPSKMRVSSENFIKDQILFEAIQQCGIMPVLPPPLQTYYGNDKLRHGIDTYKNSLLDTGQVIHSFIQPIKYDTDEDVLSFQFLNSVNLQQLMACQPDGPLGAPPGEVFQRLLPDGFQPRAYEFLLQRLTDKFSILTKECDEIIRQELHMAHGGRPKKELRREFKVRELDAFIDSFVNQLLSKGQVTPENFYRIIMSELIIPLNAACFEGEEVDISKFRELAPDQCKYWIYHLLEMIMFYYNLSMVRGDLGYLCVENIKKYSKLLFLLKNYLPMDPEVVQAAVQQAAMQQAAVQQAAVQQATTLLSTSKRDPGKKTATAGPKRSTEPKSGAITRTPAKPDEVAGILSSLTKGKGQGGGSPKASETKSKPKTRNNRYSKNARTRKNKHKRKQHRNRKYKKTTNTKSNRRTKSQSKKNVTFKRRRR